MSFGMFCLSSEDDDDGASGDVKNDDDGDNDVIWMMVRTRLYNLTTTVTMVGGEDSLMVKMAFVHMW